jgi:hypothetical protein
MKISNRTRAVLVAIVAIFAAFGLAGCSSVSTDSNQVAVHVDDYMIIPTSKEIQEECIPSSTQQYHGPGDQYFTYPDGERTYKFSRDEGSDGTAVAIVKGNIPLTITGVVSFRLNTDCATLKEFHRLIGTKQWPSRDGKTNNPAYVNETWDGWNSMLDTYLEQAILSSATAASAQIKEDYLSIYNGAGRASLEQAMAKLLPTYVEQLSGGKYFKDFRITVNKPTIDRQDVLDAIASKTVATLQNEAQEQKNLAVETELKSIEDLVAVLGPQGYIDYVKNNLSKQQLDLLAKAIESGKVTILPVPQGSSLALPTTQ